MILNPVALWAVDSTLRMSACEACRHRQGSGRPGGGGAGAESRTGISLSKHAPPQPHSPKSYSRLQSCAVRQTCDLHPSHCTPPPPRRRTTPAPTSDDCGKKRNLLLGKSCWAIFGTHNPPPPPLFQYRGAAARLPPRRGGGGLLSLGFTRQVQSSGGGDAQPPTATPAPVGTDGGAHSPRSGQGRSSEDPT